MSEDTYSDMRFTPSGKGGGVASERGGGSSISRQFSDTENSVNERLDSFLQSPSIRIGQGENLGEVYSGIRDDLALRSNLAGELNREQDMAYQQSGRQQLAKQADENDRWTGQAQEAFGRLAQGAKAGKDFKEMITEEMANTPGLALNPVFARGASQFGAHYESGVDHDLRQTIDSIHSLELGTKKFDLETMGRFRDEHPELADKMIDQADKAMQAGGFASDNQLLAQQVESAKRLKEWQDIQNVQNAWKVDGLSGNPDPSLGGASQQDQLAMIRDSFNMNGLHGIDRPEDIIRNASPGVKSMLANKSFLDRALQTPEAKESLVQALNVANSRDPEVDPAAKQKAIGYILDLSGQHAREMGDIPQREATRKLLEDASKEYNTVIQGVNSGYTTTSKAMQTILLNKNLKKPEKVQNLISEAQGFVEQIGLAAENQENVGKVLKEYTSYLDGVDKNSDPAGVSQQLRTLMGNFVTKLKQEGALPSKPTVESLQNGPEMDRGAPILTPDQVNKAKTPSAATANPRNTTANPTKNLGTGGAFSAFTAPGGFKAPPMDTDRIAVRNAAQQKKDQSDHVPAHY